MKLFWIFLALLALAGCANQYGVIVFDQATCHVDPASCR